MKMAIIYKTVLGSTKKYAQWIAETYDADMYRYKDVSDETLLEYDLVIVLSGTYASKMPLVSFLQKHWESLSGKRIIVVAVGIAPPDVKESLKQYETIPKYIQEKIHYFKIPGKLFVPGPGGEPSKEKLQPVFNDIDAMLNA